MDKKPATTPTPKVEVEMYEPPNTSRLEPHLAFISELRRCRWPYQQIAERLRTECGVAIGVSALHEFCRRRGIVKGKGETSAAMPGESGIAHRDRLPGSSPTPTPPQTRKTKNAKFFFRDGPLRTRSNGLLKDE